MFDINKIISELKDETVLILANGTTTIDQQAGCYMNYSGICKHIWTVNGGWRNHHYSTLGFMMDDWCSIAHDIDNNSREDKATALKETTIPVVVPTVYPDFDCFVRYPIEKVIQATERAYFGETVSYMIAFAIMAGIKELIFAGCDYMGCKPAERACTESWIGYALGRGLSINVTPESHFMRTETDGINNHIPNFYGYIPETFPFDWIDEGKGTCNIVLKATRQKEIETFVADYKNFLRKRNGNEEKKAG